MIEASRHGRYDTAKQTVMDKLVEHERGLLLPPADPWFNNLVPESWSGLTAGVGFQPEEIEVALARTAAAVAPAAGQCTADPVPPQADRWLPAVGHVER